MRFGTAMLQLAAALVVVTAPGWGVSSQQTGEIVVTEQGRPWLGVLLGDALDGGVEIVAVYTGGPAQVAGVRSGDLLVSLDGGRVLHRKEVAEFMATKAPGETVVVEYLRGQDPREVNVALRSRSGPVWAPRVGAPEGRGVLGRISVETMLGASVVSIPDALRVHYNAPADAGVLVSRVTRGGDDGLRVGDVIVRVGTNAIRRPEDVLGSFLGVRGGETTEITVVRDGKTTVVRYAVPSIGPTIPGSPSRVRWAEVERSTQIERLEAEIRLLEQRIEELRRERDRLRESEAP